MQIMPHACCTLSMQHTLIVQALVLSYPSTAFSVMQLTALSLAWYHAAVGCM